MENFKKAKSRYVNLKKRSFNRLLEIYYDYLFKNQMDINTISEKGFTEFIEFMEKKNNQKNYYELNRKLWQYPRTISKIIEFDSKYSIGELTSIIKTWEKNNG
ncbi:MAG: hypothetical protein HY738_15220 [Bacteroidia bacterium]|nr:hypothetical protein [Bacteroidia bacterium]